MFPMSQPPTGNKQSRSKPREDVGAAVFAQIVRILKARGDCDVAKFREFLADVEPYIVLPEQQTAGWLTRIAENLVVDFYEWLAERRS